MDKFGRNYVLNIHTVSGLTITVKPPFTVEFDITRNTLSSANVCQVRVYNLSLVNRNLIRKNVTDFGNTSQISLEAGYGERITEIFTGTISQAWSVREGTNFITQIECFDGGFSFVNGKSNRAFPAGTFIKSIILSLIGDLPGIKLGAIGSYPGQIQKGASYKGNTVELLREFGGFFIDGGKAYMLGNSEYVAKDDTLVINADTGLLGTPTLEQNIAHFDMLFEPALNIGRRVKIESATEADFNGYYVCTQVKHRGVISESVSGTAVTSGQFVFYKLLTPAS